MDAVRCSACKSVLFEVVPLDAQGNWAIDEESDFELQTDALGDYVECPQCGVKNVVLPSMSPTGLQGCRVEGVR